MAFGFAPPPADIYLRAKGGLSLDPSLPDDQVSAQAAQALDAAPQAQQQAPQQGAIPNDIPVAPWEVAFSMLTGGGTPGEAAQRVRAVKVQSVLDQIALQQAQQRFKLSQGLGARDQLDYLTNPAKFAESDAKNIEPQQISAGNTTTFRGGPGSPGGFSIFAPKTEITPAGVPTTFTSPTDFRVVGSQLPGQKTVDKGLITDNNTGAVLGRFGVPQIVKPGEALDFVKPPVSGASAPAPGGVGAPPQAGAGLGAMVDQTGRLNPSAFFRGFVMPQEGGLNAHDLNGAPTKYGINQSANPGVNVPNLSPEQAEQVFTTKYFGPSGAANLPPALAAVHADTYFINPKMARNFLAQSGGDPAKYLQLRENWMQNILAKNPAAQKYAQAWSSRNSALEGLIGQQQAQQPQAAQDGLPAEVTEAAHGVSAFRPLIDPNERAAAGINPNDHGSYIITPEGPKKVADDPYGSEWAKGTRQQFIESEPYKQNNAAASALQALQHNIGQMTGPAAYTLLDTMARTINPGAVARQGTIAAIEDMMGLPAHVVGSLMNIQGKGRIPLSTQQQILDAVTPFAQAHWDQANAMGAANRDLAQRHGANPEDVVAPIGERPAAMRVGAVPPPEARQPNTIYQTPKGLALYLGNGQWRKLP